MTETAEYGLCFIAAAILCITEGMLVLACLFGGLAVRAIWHRLMLTYSETKQNAHR